MFISLNGIVSSQSVQQSKYWEEKDNVIGADSINRAFVECNDKFYTITFKNSEVDYFNFRPNEDKNNKYLDAELNLILQILTNVEISMIIYYYIFSSVQFHI